jgi:hypothetical protein
VRNRRLSPSDTHDQRLSAVEKRVVIYIASVDKRHGFPHVLQSSWKPLRDLVRWNVVTSLQNTRFDTLDRKFRGTNVQVIEKDPKPVLAGLFNKLDLGGMGEHGLGNETPALLDELSASLCCETCGLIRVPWIQCETTRALNLISVHER